MTTTTTIRAAVATGLLATLVLGAGICFGQSPPQQIPLQVVLLKDAAAACLLPLVSPGAGNLYLRLPVPGSGTNPNHWIRWAAPHAFQMKFEGLAVHGQPKPKSDLSDEKNGYGLTPTRFPIQMTSRSR